MRDRLREAHDEARRRRPVRRARRRWSRVLGLLVLLVVAAVPVLYLFMDARLVRVAALSDYPGRPGATPGQDWLIVGSDSRQGLTPDQQHRLHTGRAAGQRTDTIMLMHIPAVGGPATLISLPRDSYVPIPGHGRTKLNAAFAFGGPRLLTRTVEQVSGIRIDHYAEVGFGGFVGLVDAVGGVRICVAQPIDDPKAGIDLRPGCRHLDGAQALGYVRSRRFPRGDLERVRHQRQLLGALLSKATSPGVLLDPFRSIPLITEGARAFTVDDGTHLDDLGRLALALRAVGTGGTVTGTVPIAGFGTEPGAGSVVLWDRQRARELFDALRDDRPVPGNVLG